MKIVGLEEHFATPELIDAWHALEPQWRDVALVSSADDRLARRLLDVDTERIAAMDDTGLDVAVVSMTTPGLQNLTPRDAVALQVVCNDRLAEAVRRHPDRLQGFATLGHAGSGRCLSRTRQSRNRTRVQRRHALRANA